MSIEVLERGTIYLGDATPESGGGSAATIESLNVTPSTSSQTITATGGVDGYSPVNVSPVTSSIDANIVAGNIKKDVTILGITGTFQGGGDTITAANNTGSAISEGDKVWINKVAGDGFQLIAYASAYSVSLTGVADENIANNSTGYVKTVLPVEISVSVTVDADNATINLE